MTIGKGKKAAASPPTVAEGEWQREARRVLPLLVRPRTVLAPEEHGTWGLYSPKSRWRRATARISEGVGHRLVKEELLRPAPTEPEVTQFLGNTVYGLSELGVSFVRRGVGEQAFADQHRVFERRIVEDQGTRRIKRVNITETPTGWLRKRKNARGEPFINEAEYEAGERLRRDFALAGLEPRVTPGWQMERVDVSPRTDYSDMRGGAAAEGAKRRFWAAVDAMGPELAPPTVAVVCFGQGLEEMERGAELPLRAGKTLLKFALAALARHYGLLPRPSARVRVASFIKTG